MSEHDVPTISVRADVCRRDGLCVKLCPVRIFGAAAGEVPTTRRHEECCLCGQCVAGCPSGAIVHSGFAPERLERVDNRGSMSAEAVRAFMARRRSVLLGIPAGHRCYAAATIGIPAIKLHSVPRRDVAVTWVGGSPAARA